MADAPYKIVIGLEVHVQLSTKSKLFCGCSTEFGAPPNTQVCPVCLGLPGSLPVMNAQAVELAIRTGSALNCEIASITKWDRKNYFYPDLPKGYQISQFDQPICGEGYLDFADPEKEGETLRVRLIRAHLEEDAGKSMHDEASGKADSRIDLNRTGTPLLEIVSHPDLTSAAAAKAYLTELRLLLTYLGVSDCNMQEGSLRADANVNLHILEAGQTIATPIVEVKNLNSFRAVERAITYESQRQYDQWLKTQQKIGDAPKQTRGWDDEAGVTVAQREKEESSDYRYFPDPDLVPINISAEQMATAQSRAELPAAIRRRLESDLGLKAYDADVIVSQGRGMVEYFDSTVAAGASAKRVSSWVQQDVMRTIKEQNWTIDHFPLKPATFAGLLQAIDEGVIDNSRGKEVFQFWLQNPDVDLDTAKKALGIASVDRNEIANLCRELLTENPQVVTQVRGGNLKGLGSLIGAAKKKNPNADPKLVREMCQQMIESGAV